MARCTFEALLLVSSCSDAPQVHMQDWCEHMGVPQLITGSKRLDGETLINLLFASKFANDIQHHVRRLPCSAHAIQRKMASPAKDHAHNPQQDQLSDLCPVSGTGV